MIKKFECKDFVEVDCNDGHNCANCERLPCDKWTECADCGAGPDESTRFGGFNRPLCKDCRIIEIERIDKYVEVYGNVPAEQCPDMRTWMAALRHCTTCNELVSGDGIEKKTGRCYHCFINPLFCGDEKPVCEDCGKPCEENEEGELYCERCTIERTAGKADMKHDMAKDRMLTADEEEFISEPEHHK